MVEKNLSDKRFELSEKLLRQNCLKMAIDLHGQKSKAETVVKTAEEFVTWVKKK